MTARRDSSDEPEHGSLGGRVLLGAAVVFALAATGVMVLSEQQQWLRLGIVAALWAALTGAFLAARYRKQLAEREEDALDRQAVYELELEREVAARREYELEVQAETRRQVEEESRDDIAALRGELQGLRQTLESLLGGEFLVERYALRAESTRMRSLPDDASRAVRNNLKRLPAAQAHPVAREAETDLIERVVEPRVEERPLPRRADRPTHPDWPEPAPEPRPGPRGVLPVESKAEMSDRWFVSDGLAGQAVQNGKPAAAEEQWVDGIDPEWTPSWEDRRSRHATEPPAAEAQPVNGRAKEAVEEPIAALWRKEPAHHRYADPDSGTGYEPPVAAGRAEPARSRYLDPPSETGNEPPRRGANHYLEPPSAAGYEPVANKEWSSARYVEPPSGVGYEPPPVAGRAESSRYVEPASGVGYEPPVIQERSPSRYVEPPSGTGFEASVARHGESSRYVEPPSETRHEAPSPGRRHSHAAQPDQSNGHATGNGSGGRRRRADDEPSWQETAGWQQTPTSSGSHSREEPEDPPTGSHAAGRSVSELLATHGANPSPRRRRRRED